MRMCYNMGEEQVYKLTESVTAHELRLKMVEQNLVNSAKKIQRQEKELEELKSKIAALESKCKELSK